MSSKHDFTLPHGIYRILVDSNENVTDDALTLRPDGSVTVAPPDVEDDPRQLWEIRTLSNGNVVISKPLLPGQVGIPERPFLTFEGAPDARPLAKVIQEWGKPPQEWQVGNPNIEFRQTIQAPDTGLGIGPLVSTGGTSSLALMDKDQMYWIFNRVGEI